MDVPNPDFPKLTRNDQDVLKRLVKDAMIPDADIARSMGISPQAVFKIRQKLEKLGIIKGYTPILDLKKVGINVMVLLVIRLTPEVWEKHSDEQISERIKQIPYVINAYRIPESHASHILIMGFRDLQHMDKYLIKMQTKFAKEIEIQSVYPFSADRVITESQVGLLYEILDKTEFPLDEFFLKREDKS